MKKIIVSILFVCLFYSQFACKLIRGCESDELCKLKIIREQLRHKGYPTAADALANLETVYEPKTKILYIYVKDNMDLVHKLISDRPEIEKVAASIIDKEVKFKIFFYTDKTVKEF